MTPLLACGPSLPDLLMVSTGPLSCAAAFGGGVACYLMGNRKLGCWTMAVSALVGMCVVIGMSRA